MLKALGFIRWIILGLFALAIGPFTVTAGSLVYFSASGIILPDVTVGGVPVGGMTEREAAVFLEQAWNRQFKVTAVDLEHPTRLWVVAPAEFGLRVDAVASAKMAAGLIQAGGLLGRASQMLAVLRDGFDLQPIVAFDPVQAQIAYSSWQSKLELPASDANLTIEAGEMKVDAAQTGWQLDVLSSIEMIAESPDAMLLEHRTIPFVMRPVEPARTDVSGVADRVEDLLANPPALQAYDPVTDEHFQWTPKRIEIASWLQLHDDGAEVSLEIDAQRIDAFIAHSMDELGTEREFDLALARETLITQLSGGEPDQLIVTYLPTKYRVRAGDQWISLSFRIGMPYWKLQEVNPEAVRQSLTPGEEIVIPPRDAMFTLPVVPGKRIVVDLSEQRMRVYEQGALLAENIVSTGMPDSPTMPGIFQISTHELNAYASIWDLYMPHFMGIYDAVPGLTNGIHGLPMLSSGQRLWANVLGRPASFGCIILDLEAAEELYVWAEDGVVVVIQD